MSKLPDIEEHMKQAALATVVDPVDSDLREVMLGSVE